MKHHAHAGHHDAGVGRGGRGRRCGGAGEHRDAGDVGVPGGPGGRVGEEGEDEGGGGVDEAVRGWGEGGVLEGHVCLLDWGGEVDGGSWEGGGLEGGLVDSCEAPEDVYVAIIEENIKQVLMPGTGAGKLPEGYFYDERFSSYVALVEAFRLLCPDETGFTP